MIICSFFWTKLLLFYLNTMSHQYLIFYLDIFEKQVSCKILFDTFELISDCRMIHFSSGKSINHYNQHPDLVRVLLVRCICHVVLANTASKRCKQSNCYKNLIWSLWKAYDSCGNCSRNQVGDLGGSRRRKNCRAWIRWWVNERGMLWTPRMSLFEFRHVLLELVEQEVLTWHIIIIFL